MSTEVETLHVVHHFIDGREVRSEPARTFHSINPTNGRPWAIADEADAGDVELAVNAAHGALKGEWGRLSPTRRGRLLMRFADKIAEYADRLAHLETRDNGKLLRETLAQNRAVPEWFYYFGGLADKIEGRVIPLDRTSVLNYTLHEPIGVVGVITPWNSPVALAAMACAPALAAGNTIVLKPSEVTPASSVELARLAAEAGIPSGVFNVITGGREAGQALVAHDDVAKVVFTGSVDGGRSIAAAAGSRLAQALLELGGKSANIVFADADLEAAESGLLSGIFAACGQTCVAGSRALIQREVFDEMVARLTRRAARIVIGDPVAGETQMGPVATARQLDRIERFVEEARATGAEIAAGGERLLPEGLRGGFFYAPTVVVNVDPTSAIAQDEVFGPVLCVVPFDNEEEAISLANGTRFGLAAGVWTNHVKRAHRMAGRLQAGTVWLNTYRALTYNSPFGGYKASGFGRENGIEAINEFLHTKSVWCELGDDVQDPFVIKV